VIRELREADAAAVARLEIAVNPYQVVTPRTIRYLATRENERKRRRYWVAEIDGEIVGCAQAEWPVPTPDKGRFWIGVHPEWRGRGIGGELYATAKGYLVGEGAVRVRTWVDGDPAGERFVQGLGFVGGTVDTVSEVDPRGIDVSGLPRLEGREFRVARLGEVRRRVRDLYEIWAAALRDMPSAHPETDLHFESWKRDDFEQPDLSDEGSFVALVGERPVSLAFLTVDPAPASRLQPDDGHAAGLPPPWSRAPGQARRGAMGSEGRDRAAADRERRGERQHARDQRAARLPAPLRSARLGNRIGPIAPKR
jgi:GNAT superfamily N-acetyltransferase